MGIREADLVIGCGKEVGEEYITTEVGMCMKMPDKAEITLFIGEERLIYSCSPNEYEKIVSVLSCKEVNVCLRKQSLFFVK